MSLSLPDLAKQSTMKGVCLELSHGRKRPEKDMEDWGKNGPLLGPFPGIYVEYGGDLRIVPRLGDDIFIHIENGLIYYDKVYYGNWVVVAVAALDEKQRAKIKPFSPRKHEIPAKEVKRVAALQWYVYAGSPARGAFMSVKRRVDGEKPERGPLDETTAEFAVIAKRYERRQSLHSYGTRR